jgi:hypothetical protein
VTENRILNDPNTLKVSPGASTAENDALGINRTPGVEATPENDRQEEVGNGALNSAEVEGASLAPGETATGPMSTGDKTPSLGFETHVDNVGNLYTSAIDDANEAANNGKLHDWIRHINVYLDGYKATPLLLADNPGPLLGRLKSIPLPSIDSGPLVTVIMVTHNAEDTVEYAVTSILQQTWKPLELVIVDDASEDRTWSVVSRLRQLDARIRLMQNPVNVGPYVSRNRVLGTASGSYITTHDADDWALPRRLEIQVRNLAESGGKMRANFMHMLRVQPSGLVSTARASSFCPDGIKRQAFASAMYEVELLRTELGYWDTVLYGADSEMIRRAMAFLGQGFSEIEDIGVLLADRSNSLGKQGYRTDPHAPRQVSQGWAGSNREAYRNAYDAWHQNAAVGLHRALYLPFPCRERPFPAPEEMIIETERVCRVARCGK